MGAMIQGLHVRMCERDLIEIIEIWEYWPGLEPLEHVSIGVHYAM